MKGISGSQSRTARRTFCPRNRRQRQEKMDKVEGFKRPAPNWYLSAVESETGQLNLPCCCYRISLQRSNHSAYQSSILVNARIHVSQLGFVQSNLKLRVLFAFLLPVFSHLYFDCVCTEQSSCCQQDGSSN